MPADKAVTPERKEYELTTEQYNKLIDACRPTPLIMLQCGMPRSPQEKANDAWCALGRELGFDGMTVEGSTKGDRFFSAVSIQDASLCRSPIKP